MARHSGRKTTRRPKGQGTEWQDKTSGHWRWRVRSEGQDYYVSDADRNRAKIKFDRLKEQLKKQLKIADGKQLLSEFIPIWLESIQRDVSETTYGDYIKRCRLFIIGPLGHYRLCDIDAKLIRRWLGKTRDNYAFNSAKQARAILERILDLAVEDKLIEENPARLVKPPKPPRKPDNREDEEGQHAMSADQVARVLAEARRCDAFENPGSPTIAAKSRGLYMLYTLEFKTGLRRGEILGLRWKDIDFDNRVLRVRQQVRRTDTGYEISATLKTPKARRTLPLTDELISMLRQHKLRLGPAGHALVFPNDTGEARDPQSITRNFSRIVKRLELGDFHFHDCRHTWVTMMRKAGVDLEVLGSLAGHEHTDTTANDYSEADMDRKRAAMERLA